MGAFIKGLISRHFEPAKNVAPRLPGRFEPVPGIISNYFDEPVEREKAPDKGHDNGSRIKFHHDHKPDLPEIHQNENKDLHDHPEKHALSGKEGKSFFFHHPENQKNGNKAAGGEKKDLSRDLYPVSDRPSTIFKNNEDENSDPKGFNSDSRKDNRNSKEDQAIHNRSHKAQAYREKDNLKDDFTGKTYHETRDVERLSSKETGKRNEFSSFRKSPQGMDPFSSPRDDQWAPQVIKVNIGQITIKAVNQPAQLSVHKPASSQKPVLTLEDYLKQRSKR